MMIKIMLIDDEYYIRERIKIMLDWTGLGFDITGEAEDGISALERVRECPPDVMIVDINMPKMDGLQLSRQVHELFPDIIIIILTGYNTFTYAQQAINYGVSGYLLKPINKKELMSQMETVRLKLEKKNASNGLTDAIKVDECINSLILGEENDYGEPPEYFDVLKSGISENGAFICLFRLLNQRFSLSLRQKINKSISEIFRPASCYLFEYTEITLGICFCCRYDQSAVEKLRRLHVELRRQMPSVSLFGVSREFSDIANFKKTYEQALFSLRAGIFFKKDLLPYEDALDGYNPENMPIQSLRDYLLLELKSKSLQTARDAIKSQFELLNTDYRSYDNLTLLIHELLCTATIYSGNGGLQTYQNAIHDFISNFNQIDELSLWFVDFFTHEFNLKNKKKTSSQHVIVQQAKAIIDSSYCAPDCSLDFVASQINCNPNYLSNLFKKVTGLSVVQYITSRRMELAKSLLGDSVKLAEICEKIGYNDVFYFSRRFKQYFGVPPSDFVTD